MNTTSGPKPEPVAALYARSLFELARDRGEVEAIQNDLAALSALLKDSKELDQTLAGQALSRETRAKLFEAVAEKAQLHQLVARLGTLLVARGRMSVLPAIETKFRDLVDTSKNTLRGRVTTAEPLTDAESKDLERAFGKKFNKNVVLDAAIDKEILGGLVVQIHGLTFDGSLKTTIRRLKENLERQSI